MSIAYNRLILAGYLTRDIETRYLQSGAMVGKTALAVNRKTKQGDETTFIDLIFWDKKAETASQYLKKGSPIQVEGRLSIRKYTDKEGVTRQAVECPVDNFIFLERKPDGGGGYQQGNSYQNQGGQQQQQYQQQDAWGGGADIDGEIPF
jgi:single-strand DNA-binding protein